MPPSDDTTASGLEQAEPRIFVSHSSVDGAYAEEIASALAAVGLKPWVDVQEISPGDSFVGKMDSGIGSAGYVVLLVSAAAHASRWVNREWRAALTDEATVILPVLLDDSGLPPLLRDVLYIDARRDRARAVAELLDFFDRETRQPPPRVKRDPTLADPAPRSLTRRQLRLVATRCLDALGLESFCFDADLDPNDLRGDSVNQRIVALLHDIARDGTLEKFSRWLELERPRCLRQQVYAMQSSAAWDWSLDR